MIHRRYNINKKQYIKLQDGEKFCPKCDGRGKVPKNKSSGLRFSVQLQCDKCLGDGKIDWIEEAVGKRKKQVYGFER